MKGKRLGGALVFLCEIPDVEFLWRLREGFHEGPRILEGGSVFLNRLLPYSYRQSGV